MPAIQVLLIILVGMCHWLGNDRKQNINLMNYGQIKKNRVIPG